MLFSNTKKQRNISLIVLIILHLVGFFAIRFSSLRDEVLALSFFHLLIVFVLLVLNRSKKSNYYWLFIGITFSVGMLVEWIGTKTGYLFGSYAYQANLGPTIESVPWIIGINWVTLSLTSLAIFASFKWNLNLKAFLSASLMTFLDYLIEPVAIQCNYWTWTNGVIPWTNYLTWFVISFFLHRLYLSWKLNQKDSLAFAQYFIFLFYFLAFKI